MSFKEQLYILKVLAKHDLPYEYLFDSDNITKIYNLFANNVKFQPKKGIEFYYYGVYDHINNAKINSHYVSAFNNGIGNAYNNYGLRYKTNEYIAPRHYEAAIKKGNVEALVNLGDYHKYKKCYDKMKKYYLMAITKNNVRAMVNLADYLLTIDKDEEGAIKYYEMARGRGNVGGIEQIRPLLQGKNGSG